MEGKYIEFNVISMLCNEQLFKRINDDTEILITSVDTAEVNNLNTDDLLQMKDQISFFDIATDLRSHSMTLKLKKPYIKFDNIEYINNSNIYRLMYGYNSNNYIKLMILFIYNLDSQKERKSYIKLLDSSIKDRINEFFN